MMSGFYGIKDNTIEVKNGEELSLGAHTLQFFMTPMVHWPETMMTLCKVRYLTSLQAMLSAVLVH